MNKNCSPRCEAGKFKILKQGLPFGGFSDLSEESNISQKQRDNSQTKGNSGSSSGIVEINSWSHNESSFSLNATDKENIANKRWLVNQKKNLSLVGLGEIEGTINTAASQAADKLTNSSEITDAQIEPISQTVAEQYNIVNEFVRDGTVGGLPFGGFSFSSECYIDQYKSNKNQSIGNSSQQINSNKIHNDFFLNKYATNNDTIPQKISSVNTNVLDDCSNPGNTGDTIATPNQNTEKLINQSAMTENNTESNLPIYDNSNIEADNFQMIFPVNDLFNEGKINIEGKKESNNHQAQSNQGSSIGIVEINSSSHNDDLSMFLGSKQYQGNEKNSSYKEQAKSNSGTSEEFLNVHIDLLFSDNQSVTNTSINVLEENNFIYSTVSEDKTAVNETDFFLNIYPNNYETI